MNVESLNKRIIELETRLTYQDHTIEQLNEVVTSQQNQIARLESDIKRIKAHLKAGDSNIARPEEESPSLLPRNTIRIRFQCVDDNPDARLIEAA